MIATPICGKCSRPIPAGDPDGLCARCLMESALAPEFALDDRSAIQFGVYEIICEIGRGGQGVVYRAQQKALNRMVALKCIPVSQFTSKERLKRFRLEAEAAARLDHPLIVPIFEVGECNGFCFFSMKLMDGGRLDQALKGEPMNARAAVELLVTISQTVHFAHQRGILHRDLKPANILLDGAGRPHLSDFGLARLIEQDSTITHTLAVLGTPSYMAPEQAGGAESRAGESREITTEADVYGLGAILYHLLTGGPPFAAGTTFETVRLLLETNPRRPSLLNRAVDRDLETICLKCLEKTPHRRYGSAEALAEELERWLRREPIAARPVGPIERLWRWCWRNPAFATLCAVIAFLLLVLGVGAPFAAFRINRERQLAEAEAYAADMHHVQQVWSEGNLRQAQALLRRYVPEPSGHDLRGFEWRYLANLCRDESHWTFTNFPSSVTAALSPDGSFLAASSGEVLKLLDHRAGTKLKTLALPSGIEPFQGLAFSPRDTNVLATIGGHTLILWDLAAAQVKWSMTLSRRATMIAFSTDGSKLVVAGGPDRVLEVWDAVLHSQLWHPSDPLAGDISFAAFTPNGIGLIAGGGIAGNPLLFNLSTGGRTALPMADSATFGALDFLPDGESFLTGANDSKVVLWKMPDGTSELQFVHPGSAVTALKLSHDGNFLLTGADDATVRLWDWRRGVQIRVFRGHRQGITSVWFSRDNKTIISSSEDGTVKTWDLNPRRFPSEILQTNQGWTASLTFSRDGKRLAAADLSTGVVSLFDVSTRSCLTNLTQASTNYAGTSVCFSPNGRWLAAASHDQRIRVWDAETLQIKYILTNSFAANSLAISADSRFLALAGQDNAETPIMNDRLAFFDLQKKVRVPLLADAMPGAACVAFSGRRFLVAIGYMTGEVRIWNYQTGALIRDYHDQRSRIWNLAFSPDDSLVAAGGNDGAVVFYDFKHGQSFRSPAETSWWVLGLAFSPDGKTLASAESDGIRVWNVFSRRSALELRGHGGIVSKVAFSPDGTILASCGADRTVRFWPAPPVAGR